MNLARLAALATVGYIGGRLAADAVDAAKRRRIRAASMNDWTLEEVGNE